MSEKRLSIPALAVVAIVGSLFPFVSSIYQTNIMTTALMYVVLGLGLNIVVGSGGLLNLGYVAFYAAGAYTLRPFVSPFRSRLLAGPAPGRTRRDHPRHPPRFAGAAAAGDYLAIVTLGFGEITRLVLENWNEFSFGPSGISGIPRPGLFGMETRHA